MLLLERLCVAALLCALLLSVDAAHVSQINGVNCNHPPYWTVGRDIYVTEDSFTDSYEREGLHWGPMIHDGQKGLPGNDPGYPGDCPNDPVLRNPLIPCTCAPMSMQPVCNVAPPDGTWCPVFPPGVDHACFCRQSLYFKDVTITPDGIVCNVDLSTCWVGPQISPTCLSDDEAQCRDKDWMGMKLGTKYYGVDLKFDLCPCGFGSVTVCATLCDDKWGTQEMPPGTGGFSIDCDDQDCAPSLCFNIHVEQVNNCPEWTHVPEIRVTEDQATPSCHTFANAISYGCKWEGHDQSHPQEIYFDIACDNDALYQNRPTVQYVQGQATAQLCYSTAPDRSGCSVCTITIYDTGGVTNGGCNKGDTQSVTICVEEINDPPTFVPGPTTLSVDEDASNTCTPSGCSQGPYTYQNWATSLSTGPGWEVCAETGLCCQPDTCDMRQTLDRFEVTLVDPCYSVLFTVPPAIDVNTGDLTFTLAQHANTVGADKVEMNIVLFDSGQDSGACKLANDGSCHQADSDALAFTLIIKPENDVPSFVPQFLQLQMKEDEVYPATLWAGDMCIGSWTASGCANQPCTATCLQDACCGTRPCPCDFCNEANDPESQQFVWEIDVDNKELFDQAAQPAIDATGHLTFTLATDVNGVARVKVTLKDDGGQYANAAIGNTAELVISVSPENDRPTFTIPATYSTGKCNPCTQQSEPLFATDIDTGSFWTDEDTQLLSWASNAPTVNNDNTALFSEQPWLEMSGDRRTSTLRYTLAAGQSGIATVTVTLADNGDATDCNVGCAVCNGGAAKPRAQSCDRLTQTFTFTVAESNAPPTFNIVHPGQDITVLEDPTPAEVVISPYSTHSAGDAVEDTTQTVTYYITPADPTLFTATGQPTIDAAGDLRFTPAPDAYGQTTLTIKVGDNGFPAKESDVQDVTLTILPVNDAPLFSYPAELPTGTGTAYDPCNADAGCPVSVTFAAGIAMGPPNESGQKPLAWAVECPNHPTLFKDATFDTTTGELSFVFLKGEDTSASATGERCRVTLQDDGGVANSGVDTFIAEFNLKVLPNTAPPTFIVRSNGVMLEDDPPTTLRQAVVMVVSSTSPITTKCGDGSTVVKTCTLDPVTGDITIYLHAELYGDENVAISVCNPGGCTDKTFFLQVIPVNDAPSFTSITDVVVLEAPGIPSEVAPPAVEVTDLMDGTHYYKVKVTEGRKGSLTAAGVPTETEQTLTYHLRTEARMGMDDIFTAPPRINSQGFLTFTTKGTGSQIVKVYVQDDGGISNRGVDVSLESEFQVDVRHFNTAPTFQLLKRTITLQEPDSTLVHTEASMVGTIAKGFYAEEASQKLSASVACVGSTQCSSLFSGAASLDLETTDLTLSVVADKFTPPEGCACGIVVEDDGPQGPPSGHRHRSLETAFTLIITAVNDPPAFVSGPDVVTTMNEQLRAPQWADTTKISAGPYEEQSLQFIVTWKDTTLLSQVTVDPLTGDLQVVPATDKVGRTPVTLCLRDVEGAETCKEDAFVVTVLPVGLVGVPTFISAGAITVEEDSVPYTAAWASQMQTGDPTDNTRALAGFKPRILHGAEMFAPGGAPEISLDGTLSFTLAPDMNGQVTVEVQLEEVNGAVSNPHQLLINVTPVDDRPTFTAGGDVTVLEDVPGYDAMWCTALSAGAPNEALADLQFETRVSDTTLFSKQPEVVVKDTLCALRFTPLPNVHGTTSVTVKLSDKTYTTTEVTFTVAITAVNDVPTWVFPTSTLYVSEDFGSTTLRVASSLFPGAREDSQSLSVEVTVLQGADVIEGTPSVTVNGATADLQLQSKQNAFGALVLSMVLKDSGGTANGGVDATAPQQVRVVVRDVNDPPSFTIASNATLVEDTTLTVPSFVVGISPGPGETSQRVKMAVLLTNGGILEKVELSDDGTLTIKPVADAFGSSSVTVEAVDVDDANAAHIPMTARQDFTVTVNAVNDPPQLSVVQGDVSAESGIAFSLRVMDSIVPGPPNEAAQNVQVTVEADDASLFSVPPSVSSPQGILTFTGAKAGTTTIRVSAKDDAGTSNGGIDTSEVRTVSVTLTSRVTPSFVLTRTQVSVGPGEHFIQMTTDVQHVTGQPRYQLEFNGTAGLLLFHQMPTVDAQGRLVLNAKGDVGVAQFRLDLTDSLTGLTSPAQYFSVFTTNDLVKQFQLVSFLAPNEVSADVWERAIAVALGVSQNAVTVKGIRPDDTGKTNGGTQVFVDLTYDGAEAGAAELLRLGNDPTTTVSNTLRLFNATSTCIIVEGDRCFPAVSTCSVHLTKTPCNADARCIYSDTLASCQPRDCSVLGKTDCDLYPYCTYTNATCVRSCVDRAEADCLAEDTCMWDTTCLDLVDNGGGGGLPDWVIPVAVVGGLLAIAGIVSYVVWKAKQKDTKHKEVEVETSSDARDANSLEMSDSGGQRTNPILDTFQGPGQQGNVYKYVSAFFGRDLFARNIPSSFLSFFLGG